MMKKEVLWGAIAVAMVLFAHNPEWALGVLEEIFRLLTKFLEVSETGGSAMSKATAGLRG